MAREGRGWKIPEIQEYHSLKEGRANLPLKIKKNIYNKPIQGRVERVIAQLIQIEIQNNFRRGQIPYGLRWLTAHQFLNRIKDYLWRWKEQGYPTEMEGENGI